MLPLDDIRVLEVSYGIAAPVATRTLAHFGADVIRVESAQRPESFRISQAGWVPPSTPWEISRDSNIGLNGFTGPEKRSLVLELQTEEGMAIFRRLLEHADVLVMNMSVDAVAGLGLQYEDLREQHPALLYVNLFAFGSTGPYSGFRTWGGNLSSLAGINGQIGWPDRPPCGMQLSFPDYPSAMWGVLAVVAALLERDETGKGCELELSQFQVALECTAPSLAHAVLTGDGVQRSGDRVAGSAPNGVFPTREEGRYVVVSVADHATWARLGDVPGLAELVADPSFATNEQRLARRDDVEAALGQWTSTRTGWEVAWELQDAGVPAFPVVDQVEVVADPQLAARDAFQALPHPRFGTDFCFGQGITLTETPARYTRAGAAFGQDTRDVLRDLAGLDDDAIDGLIERGITHDMAELDVRLERPGLNWVANVLRLPWPESRIDTAQVLFDQLLADHGTPDA